MVDYALQRRALLAEVTAGRLATAEVCDAHPYLLRAAQYHGDNGDVPCPICRRDRLTLVHYVYGDELRTASGQARSRAELPKMAMDHGEFRVYVVEVCRGCSWNHLVQSYVLGRDALPGAAARPPAGSEMGRARKSGQARD